MLEAALIRAEQTGETAWIQLVKAKLGGALIMTQDPERAALLLHEALEGARAGKDQEAEAEVLNDLGNLFATQQNHAEALAAYLASVGLAQATGNAWLTAQALCNAAAAASRAGDPDQARDLNAQALLELDRLDDSHGKAFLFLTAGQTDREILSHESAPVEPLLQRARRSFERALDLGERLEDRAIETYALGYLAQLYDQDGQPEAAMALAQRAAFVAQQAQMPEALYRWEWQMGRLLAGAG